MMTNEDINESMCIGLPRIHHLKPSTIPTIGFNINHNLHFSGTTLLSNPTGVIYNPNCTMNGIMYLKSRYLTFTAVRYNPIPIEQRNAIKIKNGKRIICHEGMNRNQMNMPVIITKDIPRSTRLVITELAGMIILGK